ncbi:MAG: nuclear transport factor 2 family protein [Rhizomicrobium sp.]
MKRLVLLLAVLPCALAQAAEPPRSVRDHAEVERYIRACESDWAAAGVTNNAKSLAACLADDYQGVSSKGKVVDKAYHLTPPGPSDVVSDTVDYVHLRYASPDVIIAQGGETALTKSGKRHSLIWTDVWMLRQGKWQIVTSQDSPLAPR